MLVCLEIHLIFVQVKLEEMNPTPGVDPVLLQSFIVEQIVDVDSPKSPDDLLSFFFFFLSYLASCLGFHCFLTGW